MQKKKKLKGNIDVILNTSETRLKAVLCERVSYVYIYTHTHTYIYMFACDECTFRDSPDL